MLVRLSASLYRQSLCCCCLFVLLASLPAGAAGQGDWWMFQHDAQHTGRSACCGPAVPTLKWTYTAAGPIEDAPVIGGDGTLYFGADDSALHALNPDGSLKWTYPSDAYITISPPRPGGNCKPIPPRRHACRYRACRATICCPLPRRMALPAWR